MPVPYCLDDCSFAEQSDIRESDSLALFFFHKIALAIWNLLCSYTNKNFFKNYVNNVVDNLLGTALNL